ncbi:putative general negative regulator of transcription C16C9.04c [Helianthus annuus]|uniref:putative general negative regulator of transcription C16C9.04c n=1 Tax=Helianthus annuus TaxID=4232 RepID=UPI001652D90A|nr:putative general negative regulator of transcription C16C9.04c [Helianthus annuus]
MKRQKATMSDEGEKTCPLCVEEMDLTDQQPRPCKRSFDICVWCRHYIMDMAEKDDTEGMIQKGGVQHIVCLTTRKR